MRANMDSVYWRSNPEWYFINESGDFELTKLAPIRAIESFKLFNMPRAEREKEREKRRRKKG